MQKPGKIDILPNGFMIHSMMIGQIFHSELFDKKGNSTQITTQSPSHNINVAILKEAIRFC